MLEANWKYAVVDLADDVTTVKPGSVAVRGFYVNTVLSAHACNINDGATTVFVIPASTAAGTLVEFTALEAVIFDNSLIVDPNDAATGSITIIYKERVR